MKKTLLTIALAGIISFSYVMAANATAIKFTKPTIQVDTSKEESAIKAQQEAFKNKIDKTKSDIEKSKTEAKAKQEANKKAAEARTKQRQDAINAFKDSFK